MWQDIWRKLQTDMGFPENAISKITDHIFGVKEGPTFHEGLVDAKLGSEFDSKLMLFERSWAEYEQCRMKRSEKQQSFYAWFCKYHSEVVKKTMLCSVRVAAGLGDPPSEFCTNDNEAINSMLKQFLGFKKSDWPVFNHKIKKFIQDQEEEVCKSIIGLGQYRICREYQHFEVFPSQWFTALSEKQKESFKKKFQQASVDDKQPSNNAGGSLNETVLLSYL